LGGAVILVPTVGLVVLLSFPNFLSRWADHHRAWAAASYVLLCAASFVFSHRRSIRR
jgi:hypothetical protein